MVTAETLTDALITALVLTSIWLYWLIDSRNEDYRGFIRWIVDFSGLRFIGWKIRPPKKETTEDQKSRPPATFFLWVFGTYIAFFGIASQRYENRVDVIENRANVIITQLPTQAFKKAISRIPDVQDMWCPEKPDIWQPFTIIRSIFFKYTDYPDIVQLLKETVENWKESLDGVDLAKAKLVEAKLGYANLQGTNLYKANLKGAKLQCVKLQGADLLEANLQEAYLFGANLEGAKNLTIKQLSEVKTLYEAKLDPSLMEQVKKKYPLLLGNPN